MRHPILHVLTPLVALTGFVAAASAADFPRKAPAYTPPYVPTYSWTGFYAGVHGGYGWSHFTGSDPSGAGGTGTADARGALGGLQLGYNFQIGGFVIGAEGDYSFADVRYRLASPFATGGDISLKNDFFATLGGRLGYAFDRFLVFGKGGVAWTRDRWDVTDGAGGTANGTFNRTGFVVGAGVEYAVWESLSVKAEYNYLEFRPITEALNAGGGLTVTPANVGLQSHLIKVGLNYRFF
jgi:outer membrane immunogenic protein